MNIEILGLNVVKYIATSVTGGEGDFKYSDQEFVGHELFGMDLDFKHFVKISLRVEEGICGSGWTTASYGVMNVETIERLPAMQFRSSPKVTISFTESSEIENEVFTYSEYGGDNYYPMGGYAVNMSIFKSNGRGIENEEDVKRKIWIFKGSSASGKTFLSDKVEGLKKYETDSSPKLPKEILADIIVIGNKYDFSVKKIKKRIPNIEKVDIVIVKFSM